MGLVYMDMGRDSPVGIATGYGPDGRGVGVRVPSSRPVLGAYPSSYPIGTRDSLLGGK
jgi:hypothetical protein